MKTMKFLVLGLLIHFSTVNGQVSVNVNLGTPPVWAPAEPVKTQYYYLPEIDTYYDVPSARFIYLNNGAWVRTKNIPPRYGNYKLKGSKIIYLTDYRGNTPYKFHKAHKVKYHGKGNYVVVKEKKGPKGKGKKH